MHFGIMAQEIIDKSDFSGKTGVVLGSGLSNICREVEPISIISYNDIPNFPISTVEGHKSEMLIGLLDEAEIIIASGRFHYYEGYSFHEVTSVVKLFHELGVENIIITNSSGALNKSFSPGELMVVTGHMDCTYRHSSIDPKLYKGTPYYDPNLVELTFKCAKKMGINLRDGNYCWTQGPSYETPAEVQELINLGGDAVGMSTVPEIIASGKFGIRTLVLSCLTNMAAGITNKPLSHIDVVNMAEKSSKEICRLLLGLVQEL